LVSVVFPRDNQGESPHFFIWYGTVFDKILGSSWLSRKSRLFLLGGLKRDALSYWLNADVMPSLFG
jgi:hypothetical protein